jgi:hypothetical protein
MIGDGMPETIQVEGIYLDNSAQLKPPPGTIDVFGNQAEAKSIGYSDENSASRKMLEIITDQLGSTAKRHRNNEEQLAHDILNGVRGWEHLVGDMFGADHAAIGMDGMCLIQNCIGGRASPATIADLFFRRYGYSSSPQLPEY